VLKLAREFVERYDMPFSGDHSTQTQRILNPDFSSERRISNRRRLRGPALLAIPDKGIVCGDMVDIGTGGFSVIVATQLESGQGCRVCFSIPVGIQKVAIDCIGIVVNSVCVMQGFRIGMRFIVTDIREQKVIERYLEDGQHNAFVEPAKPSTSDTSVKLDAPAVVNFNHEAYPKTIRMGDLGRS
jgi:hypothetical protein